MRPQVQSQSKIEFVALLLYLRAFRHFPASQSTLLDPDQPRLYHNATSQFAFRL